MGQEVSEIFLENHNSLTTSHLAFSIMSPLFVDRFGRSLRFCHLKIDTVAISDGCWSKMAMHRWEVLNFK